MKRFPSWKRQAKVLKINFRHYWFYLPLSKFHRDIGCDILSNQISRCFCIYVKGDSTWIHRISPLFVFAMRLFPWENMTIEQTDDLFTRMHVKFLLKIWLFKWWNSTQLSFTTDILELSLFFVIWVSSCWFSSRFITVLVSTLSTRLSFDNITLPARLSFDISPGTSEFNQEKYSR